MVASIEKWLNASPEARARCTSWEYTRETTCPPPGLASQQPLVSPKPEGPVPVKSLSSHMMKITEFPRHALEFTMELTACDKNRSPAAISPVTCEKSQGSLAPPPPRPCM